MPAGYSAPRQIEANATRDLMPRRLAPIIATLGLLLFGLWTARRWHQGRPAR
jgi:hypothetical protein